MFNLMHFGQCLLYDLKPLFLSLLTVTICHCIIPARFKKKKRVVDGGGFFYLFI